MKPIDLITKQINERKALIKYSQDKIVKLQEVKNVAIKSKGMEQWLGFTFRSSSQLTDEFSAFSRDFKKYIKQIVGTKYELVDFMRGHFECSGFVKNKETQKFAYFSISDVRYWKDEWFNNVLVKTAKHKEDYTGGRNSYCTLKEITKMFDCLTK